MNLIVSEFMTNTCRVRPRPTINKFTGLQGVIAVIVAINEPVDDGDYTRIVTSSGSASEFFIEPMLSCINDIDIMGHRNDQIAIHRGHEVPQYLPTEFHREVEVYRLEETNFPCFVLAASECKLVKCTDSDNYTRVSTEPRYASMTRDHQPDYVYLTSDHRRHGPAAVFEDQYPAERCFDGNESGSSRNSMDLVLCIRCLVWPPQATEWITRRRDHNWPDTATINCVVNNGCDVVQVAHPRCREDELMNESQWRLSFSRAETLLLNTWSEKQQLVYHMLRVFVSFHGKSVIKRYYIKTLLMWTFERVPEVCDTCVVNTCTQLLHELAEWLVSRRIPMYFVTGCNLFDGIQCDIPSELILMLRKVTVNDVSFWFSDVYIRRCASQYPHIASSFDVINSLTDLQRVITAISNERQRGLDEISFQDFEQVQFDLQILLVGESWKIRSHKVMIEQLQSIDSRFIDFYCALCLLRCVSMLERGHSIYEIVDLIISTMNKSRQSDISCINKWNTNTSVSVDNANSQTFLLLMKAARLSHKTKSLNDLSIVYAHHSLECNHISDFHELTSCQLNVYLACLYCSSEQYRTVMKYCLTAISSGQSGNSVECIERQLLPQFDDNIERVLGIIQLYQFILNSSLNQVQQAECSDVYSAELLAHYLVNTCLTQEHYDRACSLRNKFCIQYKKNLNDNCNVFIADVLLFFLHQEGHKQTNKKHVYSRAHNFDAILAGEKPSAAILAERKPLAQFKTNRLPALMIQLSVEYLNSFRRVMSRDYISVRDVVPRDYKAMYAYKCGLYEKCFHFSQENVDFLLYTESSSITSVMRVEKSDLLLLMDDDYLSLISLARLCGAFNNPLEGESVSQLTLSLYLLVQCKLRLRHSMTSLIDILRVIQRVHDRHDESMIINRAMMTFIYRKTVLHLKSRKCCEFVR